VAGLAEGAVRRRVPLETAVGPYILDFYSAEVRLGIEVDGSAHEGLKTYDAGRDRRLAAEGIQILRFANEEVLKDMESVVERILAAMDARLGFRY
jgi:very-short-patch-repair endonuclease